MVITAAIAVTIIAIVSMASPPYVYASRVSPYTWLICYMPKNETIPKIFNLFKTVY
jgi:hypothetical protein